MSDDVCWKCSRPLPRGAVRCPACGAPRDAAPAVALQAVPAPGVPAGLAPALASADTPAARAAAGDGVLGADFAGVPASIGARMGALTIDALVVAAAGVLAGVLLHSAALGIVIGIEVALILMVIQARTGAGIGNLVLGLRVSQETEPKSPGVGRSTVRSMISVLAGGVLVIGAWLQELTGASDPTERRRTWADRIAGTVVVAVPSRGDRRAAREAPVQVPEAAVAVSGSAAHAPIATAGAAPLVLDQAVPGVPERQAPATRAAQRAEPSGGLLLVFDTGQREQLPFPVAVTLGRAPSISVDGDRAVAVNDPERTISKNHARLEESRSGTFITDLGSTNGTSLVREDGRAMLLEAGVRTVVEEGMRIQIGQRTFTVSRLMGEQA